MVLAGVTAGSKAAVITSGYNAATSQPTRVSQTSHEALAWATLPLTYALMQQAFLVHYMIIFIIE